MENSIYQISLSGLGISILMVVPVLLILYFWKLQYGNALYAVARMLLQLILVGYALSYIFATSSSLVVLAILSLMVFVSSWIALGSVATERRQQYVTALIAIAVGGGFVLLVTTQVVLDLQPWYSPHYLIPIAGMIFANSMNSVSLAAERLQMELKSRGSFDDSRSNAFHAAMIPAINSLFAVGIVSLPGMMTGQILSGVSPLIAARYQIVVMCMIFSSTGLSTAIYLWLCRKHRQQLADPI